MRSTTARKNTVRVTRLRRSASQLSNTTNKPNTDDAFDSHAAHVNTHIRSLPNTTFEYHHNIISPASCKTDELIKSTKTTTIHQQQT